MFSILAQAAKDCHWEALQRQKKRKSRNAAESTKAWTYQCQMESLTPFMKNRLTHMNLQDSTCSNTPPVFDNDDDVTNIDGGDEFLPPSSNEETSESIENKLPSKKLSNRGGQVQLLKTFIEAFERRVESHDELRQKILENGQSSQPYQNDPLYQFFLSMYSTIKGFPTKYQRQVQNKLYGAVAEAEEQYTSEFSQNALSPECSSYFSSNTTILPPASSVEFNHNLKQQYPEFFEPEISNFNTFSS